MINDARISSSKSKAQETSPSTSKDKPFAILNLSQLLDHKVLPPSETIMRYRLNSQRSVRNEDQLKFSDSQLNTINSNQRTPLKINYQHYRAKSISEIKNYYDSINSPLQYKADYVRLANYQKKPVLIKSKSLALSPQVKGVSLTTSFKSQQLLSKNSFKIQNFAFRQEVYASSKCKSKEAVLIMSLEYKKNFEQNPNTSRLNYQKEKQKIKFLKKGSSLQKQIVVNLLKNKLVKEHQQNTKKQYTQCDILNMVKLYKGFVGFPKSAIKNPQVVSKPKTNKNSKQKFKKQNSTSKDSEFLRTYQSLPERIVEKYPKPIIGWETGPDFDIQELKNQHNTQITMDHSYGLS